MVAGLLLAAGKGERMGAFKPLVVVNHQTLLQHALNFLQALPLDKIVVVTGYQADKIQLGNTVYNPYWEEGMASSIRAGIQALRETDAVLLHLVDLPYLPIHVGEQLLKAYDNEITAPIHKSKRGHPVIFPRRYYPELLELKGDRGASSLLKRHPVTLVEVDTPAIHKDVDRL